MIRAWSLSCEFARKYMFAIMSKSVYVTIDKLVAIAIGFEILGRLFRGGAEFAPVSNIG